ncbi:hypothetical protein KFZ70_07830 [Tamlana fucoidanivorans]|uniref:POTRA domain-containing protein n=1 Tax=Allotamlana fucoidanivorans TaxID=2583814 RepID=A0A5C4SIW3_9FLAO|nr:POTRA domain-containing protein [Tamlana fucoidanivorans]TNJ43766.1 hypothetical protein FGF67_10365 [Tamlana fucoidanivorans]
MPKTPFLLIITSILFSFKGISQTLTLKITGNTLKETHILDSLGYNTLHKDLTSITEETSSLQEQLFSLGYIENILIPSKKINDSSFVYKLHLNRKFNTIYIYYKSELINQQTLNTISNKVFHDHFILNVRDIEQSLTFLNTEIAKYGHPFSKLKLTNIRIDEQHNTLKAHLSISASKKKRTINNIIIKGYEKFPRAFLKNYLKIKPNQLFNLETIQYKTAQLNSLNFAKEIKPPEVLFSKDSTSLYLYLEKSKSNTFDGFLGFGTNETTNKLQFDGYLNLNLTNNLNFGESFRLLYKSDENDQKTFEADVSLPYIFKSPVGVDLLLRIFRKDSSFTTTNQDIKIHYQINQKHKIFTGLLYTESNNLITSKTEPNISDYQTQFYTISYQYTQTQPENILFPLNEKMYFETGFGKRKTNINSEEQTQFKIEAFKIFNLNLKNSIYIRLNGASLLSSSYFENELFRFGGINSIRGFEENSLYASLFGLMNTEYRFQLSNSIYIHSIIDAAYFENDIQQTQQKLFGYGFGFGLLTKAGLFKFNYANGKLENTAFNFSNSKIHISLTTNF